MPPSLAEVSATIAALTAPARFQSGHCTALTRRLEAIAPTDLSPAQRAALASVAARAADIEDVKKARARSAPPALKEPRNQMSTAWSALDGVLAANTLLPGPEGAEALVLRARIFHEGAAFTRLDAVALWGTSKVMLENLDEAQLGARLEALVGGRFLAHVRHAHAQLGDAIGVGQSPAPSLPPRALASALCRFSFAVASYARALAIGLDEADEGGLTRFTSALAPVEQLRITGKPTAEERELDEPTPLDPPLPNGGPFISA